MFVEKTYKLNKEFTDTAKKYLDSESQQVNYLTAYEEARKLINSWVSTQTKEKINDLIPSGT